MSQDRSRTIEYRPLIDTLQKLDVQEVIDGVTEDWYNRTVCEVQGGAIRIGVLFGENQWHEHDDGDEFFLILEGQMLIELRGMPTVELGPRQAFLIPRGMSHRPIAPVRTVVVKLETARWSQGPQADLPPARNHS